MKRMLLSLLLLCMLPLSALAVVTLPSTVTELGDAAFAGTGMDALIVPAAVKRIGADVLADSNASYIYLQGADTILANEGGVPFVFGPAASPAAKLRNFYDAAALVTHDGLYYTIGSSALPLCAKAPGEMAGSVTIPKLVGGVPVTDVSRLVLSGTAVSEVRVPAYLGQVTGVKTIPYQTLLLSEPLPEVTEAPAGRSIRWTVQIEGAYGDVCYEWRFEQEGEAHVLLTDVPTVQYAPMREGLCTVTVTAQDAVGDAAAATGGQVKLTAVQPVYRALLVGNAYPGEDIQLDGPATDVSAMSAMLNTMSGTPYRIRTARNVTASGIQAAISTAFAGAQPSDVSLFYFSGHGTPKGELVGTGGTLLTVYSLRRALQQIPGLKIVLLDCCYSGSAISRSADGAGESPAAFNRAIISALSGASRSADNLADAGYVVLTSCRQDQTSISLAGSSGHYWGVFTYGVCYGSGYDEWNRVFLGRMPADSNEDRAITLGEAYRGVQDRVSYLNGLTPVTQSTQSYGDASQVLWRK